MKSRIINKKFEGPDRLIFYLFLIALSLRIIFFSVMRDYPLLYFQSLDEAYYVDLGKTIAAGSFGGGQGAFFMDPLYGYFLGFVFLLFGDNLSTVRLVQIFLDAFNVVIIFAIGHKVWDRRAGIFAAILWATYAVSFYYTLLMLKVTLAVTGMLLFTLLLLKVVENQRMIGWFLTGMAAGVLNYIRANFILIIPLTLVFYCFIERPNWRQFLKNVTVFMVGAMVLLSINAIRNFVLTGSPALLITSSGRILYCCNNPDNITGLYDVPSFSHSHPVTSDHDFHKEAERRSGRSLSSKEVSNYWRNETFRALKDNPEIILFLIFNKLKWTLANYEIPMNQSYQFVAEFAGIEKWPLPNYAFILALGLPGLAVGLSRRKQVGWLMIPVLTVFATLMIFFVCSRFRMPMVPFLTIGTGICLSTVWVWMKQKKWEHVVGIAVISSILFLLSMLIPPPPSDGYKEFGLAKAFYLQKNYQKAESLALSAVKNYPDNVDLYILLGRIAKTEGRINQSLQYYQEAINISPENFTVNYDLGMLYMATARYEAAIPYLEKSNLLRPDAQIMLNLARAYTETGNTAKAMRYYQKLNQRPSTD